MTDLEFLRGLIDAVDHSGIDSLEINRSGTRIRIAKTPAAAVSPFPAFPQVPVAAPSAAPTAAAPPAQIAGAAPPQAAPAAAPAEAPAPKSNLVDVKSPMVGTFYRAPAPDAPPYVEAGTTVTKGQTLCILEAMKLMNELECEVDGVIREILVEDTEPVEYGQVLFRVEPSGSK
ncbi:MAG TPA: acetyl-CoA carboxylase biotin carboxyl carrier protein [Longimicrobiales bacterium]|nr:acetyl-CoA carboxylase biotin carboxyl carrier protein [Longimicrobiales bacterium]